MTMGKGLTRARLVLLQNRWALGALVFFYAVSFCAFLAEGHRARAAALLLVYATKESSTWGTFYFNVSDMVVFGAIAGVLFGEAGRKYKPEEAARLLAGRARNHVILVGYTHLAARLRDVLVARGVPVVVVEPEGAKVDALVRESEPVVVASGRAPEDLVAAGVRHAKMVIAAMEEIDSASIVASNVRSENRACALLVRCYDDDVGDVLAKTYAARVVSTTRMAAEYVAKQAEKSGARACVVIGAKNLGVRIAGALKARGTPFIAIDPSRAALEDLAEGDPTVCGAPTDPEVLAKAQVERADLVVLTDDDLGTNMIVADRVRDVNKTCKIVCRAFHDDVAAMLARRPFSCDVISTSRHAVKMLAESGALTSIGIGPADVR